MKHDTILYSLAFVFLIVGISYVVPTLGNSYQVEFEIWHERQQVRPSGTGTWSEANLTRHIVIDTTRVIRPQIVYQISPEANLTLWFDGGDTMLRINAAGDNQYVPGAGNNFSYTIASNTLRDYYSLNLQAVMEPSPTYLFWFVLSGIFACWPAIKNAMKRNGNYRTPSQSLPSLDEDLQVWGKKFPGF